MTRLRRPARLRLARPIAVIGVGVLLAVVSLVGPAGAADSPTLEFRSVDATGPNLLIDVVHPGNDATGVTLTIGDKQYKPASVKPFAAAGVATSVMAVIDNSESVTNGPVQIAKEAVLDAFAPGSSPVSQLGVVSIGGGARVVVSPTTSATQVKAGMSDVRPMGQPALWDGIVAAANAFGPREDGAHDIVVITASTDSASSAGYTQALQAARRAGAAVHVVALSGGTPDVATLTEMVAQTGGSVQSGTSNDLRSMTTTISKQMGNEWRITVPAPAASADEVVPLTVNWGDATVTGSYAPAQFSIGSENLGPVLGSSLIDRLFSSTLAKYLIVILGCASVGMVVYAMASLVNRQRDSIDFALRHYDPSLAEEVDAVDEDEGSLAKVEFLKRAVAITGDLAQRQGLLTRVEEMLERADLPLRPAEALFFYVAIVILAAIGGALIFGNVLIVGVVVLLALILPNKVVTFLAKRRRKVFVRQLPDMLSLLAGTLRAGYAISQGFEAVSQEVDGPMGRELGRIMAEARLGRPLEEALDAAVERIQSEDFKWAVMAIKIQREVGGNLAELLLTVSDTMTQRERLRREVAALTAEGRVSAGVLGILPPALGLAMYVMNPDYIAKLFDETFGNIMLGAAAVSMIVGFAWMKKLITITV